MSMNQPKVFADFHNADTNGRLRLNCTGTIEDLASYKVLLKEGQNFVLYSEDLEADGVIEYSTEESIWVAVIDWNKIRQQGNYILG